MNENRTRKMGLLGALAAVMGMGNRGGSLPPEKIYHIKRAREDTDRPVFVPKATGSITHFNQRQRRKNRRRAWAAGDRRAFKR